MIAAAVRARAGLLLLRLTIIPPVGFPLTYVPPQCTTHGAGALSSTQPSASCSASKALCRSVFLL